MAPIDLEKTFSGSKKKFIEKCLYFKWLRHFLLAFSYWVFGFCMFLCFCCCCFHSHRTYCDALLNSYAWQIFFSYHLGISECIYWLPLKFWFIVFIDILNLMVFKSWKIIFRNFLKTTTNLKLFSWNVGQAQ